MNGYVFLSNLVAVVHLLYFMFVVVGQLLIVAGAVFRWQWVRNRWFRMVHLLAIGLVAGEAIADMPCPLTVWENQLRQLGGATPHEGSFVGRPVVLFSVEDWPDWVFRMLHVGFAMIVLATFYIVPPNWKSSSPPGEPPIDTEATI